MKRFLLTAAGSITLVLTIHAQSTSSNLFHVPFANRYLSNLRSPTAVNVDLRPGRNNIKNIGSSSKAWKNIYFSGSIYKGPIRFISTDTLKNTFVGLSAGRLTTGLNNIALGQEALYSNTTGSENTATGYQALYSNTDGGSNTAYGYQALYNNKGFGNDAFGRGLYNNTTGFFNVASGYGALYNNTEGFLNVASGAFALVRNTTGIGNTGIGQSALWTNETNSNNTALGNEAAGNSFDYSNATFLGVQTNTDSGLTNVTAIGYQAHATASNQVMIGNSSVTSIGGYANWSNFSDGRYKTNIKEDVPGLAFITQLRPVTYTLDVAGIARTAKTMVQRKSAVNMPGLNDGFSMPATAYNKLDKQQLEELKAKQEKAKVVHTGFIAQEVQQAAKKLNYDFSGVDVPKSEKNFYALRYGDFVVPLVKAVQELNKKTEEIDLLKGKIENQQQEINDLKNAVNKLMKNQATTTRNRLSGAYLEQNIPNPSNGSTVIRYHIPPNNGNAKIVITDGKGSIVKTVALNSKDNGQIIVSKGILAAGLYSYTLYVNGTQIDSKQMTLIR